MCSNGMQVGNQEFADYIDSTMDGNLVHITNKYTLFSRFTLCY